MLNLKSYLQEATKDSSMRLYGLLIVVTGCISVFLLSSVTAFALFSKQTIDYNGIAWLIGAITVFIGVGITGKAAQKRTEISSVQKN